MKPIIRITVEGGVIQGVELFPGNKGEEKKSPIVQVWDFDCQGDGGNYTNKDGDEFNLSVWTPDKISLEDLQCDEIIRPEMESGDDA